MQQYLDHEGKITGTIQNKIQDQPQLYDLWNCSRALTCCLFQPRISASSSRPDPFENRMLETMCLQKTPNVNEALERSACRDQLMGGPFLPFHHRGAGAGYLSFPTSSRGVSTPPSRISYLTCTCLLPPLLLVLSRITGSLLRCLEPSLELREYTCPNGTCYRL